MKKNRALKMLMAGWTKQNIVATFGCSVSTNRVHLTGSVKELPRPGQPRPRVTTQRQVQQIRVNHLQDRILTATATETSIQTIGRPGWIYTCKGGITRHNRTRLVVFNRNMNANVYVNKVLANIVVLFM